MAVKDNSSAHSASVYDDEVRNTIPYYEQFHDETIRLVQSAGARPKVWLDTGCGTCNLAAKAMKVFPETRFILADPSGEMLAESKKKLPACDRVLYLEPVPTQDLDLGTETPDVITAIQSHHYMDKDQRLTATRKCYDLLKHEGIFVTFENVTPTTARGIEIGKQRWLDFQLAAGKSADEAEKHIKRFGNDYHPITVEDHFFLYRVCGFRVVELLWYSCMQAGFYCIK